jgi:hypothetical protein
LGEQIKRAEREMLKAKAAYSLKNNVVETVLMTDPTLSAVHSGANASLADRCCPSIITKSYPVANSGGKEITALSATP